MVEQENKFEYYNLVYCEPYECEEVITSFIDEFKAKMALIEILRAVRGINNLDMDSFDWLRSGSNFGRDSLSYAMLYGYSGYLQIEPISINFDEEK